MKTLDEAMTTLMQPAPRDSLEARKWAPIIDEVFQHDLTKSLVLTAVGEEEEVSRWICEGLLDGKAKGLRRNRQSILLELMGRCVAMGVCIGIEMEKPE